MKQVKYIWKKEHRESLKGYLLITPAIFLLCVFTIYPLFYFVHSSLYDGSLLSRTRNFIGIENYITLFYSMNFRITLFNTVVYSFSLVVIMMILATLFAVWVNSKIQSRLNEFTMAAIFTPHIVSLVSVSMIFLWVMDPRIGVINHILQTLGFQPFPFLASPKTALASLVMMMIWKGLGYYTLLILAALKGIPKDIYEAAALDDAPKIVTFFRITLPMISPTLFFITIVATISSFQVFEIINLMTQGGPAFSTNTLVFMIYSDAFKNLKLGLASAQGVVLLMFVAILTTFYFIFLSKRVYYK